VKQHPGGPEQVPPLRPRARSTRACSEHPASADPARA
jgi:hypothetical protein